MSHPPDDRAQAPPPKENRDRMTAEPKAATAATARPAVREWQSEITVEAPPPPREWDGTCTRLPIGFPMLRNFRVIGAGDQEVFQASQDPVTGRWIGPEAQHVEDLFVQGMIMGSEAWQKRSAQSAAVSLERGVYQELRVEDGKVVQRPMTELAPRTTEQVQREWERPLAAHIKDEGKRTRELRRRERQDARSGDGSADELAEALSKLVNSTKAAGSQAPGTAAVDD